MKKIALISDGWKRLITYAWVEGIMTKIRELNQDVALYQYNCYGNWSSDEMHNKGEYNIYNLPDLSEFDGIVLDCSNIVDKKQFNYVVGLLRASNVPVVSIGYNIDGFYYVSIDNKQPIVEIMEHLYNVHGYRRFVFAGGPEDNYENSLRVDAYRRCLAKFGLSEKDNPCMYGDYDYDTGVNYMNNIISNGCGFPDVFVCANDNIAAGMCAAAEAAGYIVPDDFAITGFDNLDKAAFFRPQITTVGYDREKIGGRCFEVLLDIWSGKEVPKYNYATADCIYSESCGCANNGRVNYREYIKNQITYGVKKQADDEMLVELEGNMAKCSSYNEIIKHIADYLGKLECDGFSIVIDKKLLSGNMATRFPTQGYDWEDLVVGCVMENGEKMDISTVDELENYLEETGSQSSYLFTPIHFRDQAIGYSIMKNGRFLYDNPYFYDIHSTIVRSVESLFKQKQLEWANQRLLDTYNRDPLTGLYNRMAYSDMIEPEYRKYKEQGVKCALMFLDADRFKEINDTYGHEYGDKVLKRIAAVLNEKCPENGYAFRFGGDEFIMFYPNANERHTKRLKEEIESELAKENINVSMGIVITGFDIDKQLNDYLSIADKNMYNEKDMHKNIISS